MIAGKISMALILSYNDNGVGEGWTEGNSPAVMSDDSSQSETCHEVIGQQQWYCSLFTLNPLLSCRTLTDSLELFRNHCRSSLSYTWTWPGMIRLTWLPGLVVL